MRRGVGREDDRNVGVIVIMMAMMTMMVVEVDMVVEVEMEVEVEVEVDMEVDVGAEKTKGRTWRMSISFSRVSAVAEIAPVVGVRGAGS